jgi:hypothetical protein
VSASKAEPNLHAYSATCAYLEQLMLQADLCVQQTTFLSAELLYERVCYEASSIVRTRTSELVDVSAKSKEGINRVCKLIAVSAYRLCELRSGSLKRPIPKDVQSRLPKDKPVGEVQEGEDHSANQQDDKDEQNGQKTSSPVTSDPVMKGDQQQERNKQRYWKETSYALVDKSAKPVVHARSKTHCVRKTTRLAPLLAQELAITSGLLALRLPCATSLPEWNIRLHIMLLRLFAERNDVANAVSSIRRIHGNCNIVWKEAKAKNKTGEQWQALGNLTTELMGELQSGAPRGCFFKAADRCQQVVNALWGDRLTPKKGYVGLIWTFRWAA